MRQVRANSIRDSAERTVSSDAPVNKNRGRGIPFTIVHHRFASTKVSSR